MRVVAYGLSALALAGLVFAASAAQAATTKKGCTVGKERWDATQGKCVPGKATSSKSAKKTAAKKK
jgi:hypothetical protein